MNIILAMLMIGVLVFVHELGHFVMAKRAGITVNEFSIGMGPKLLAKEKNGTFYSLRLLPIGGYCAMAGAGYDDPDAPVDANGFNTKTLKERFSVIFAGPFMNFVLAIVLFAVAYMYFGAPAENAYIGYVSEDSPAYVGGLAEGDTILEINGTTISSWTDMSTQIQANANIEMSVIIERDGVEEEIFITPYIPDGSATAIIGVTQGLVKLSLTQAVKYGFIYTYDFTKELIVIIFEMFTGQTAVDLSGPVGIVNVVDQVAETGYMQLFLLAGILSVNLGVMNLIPLPALDGGRLTFMLIELVRGKPVSQEKEAMVNFIGIIFLFGLMIFVTYKDIVELFTGQ